MNENHRRHLAVTFHYVDDLLGEAARILATADGESPFAKYAQDCSPLQRKVVDSHVCAIRLAMTRIVTELGIPRRAPVCGALWAAQAEVGTARIAVAEIRPQVMRGYGALTENDVTRIDGIVAELDAALERLTTYLAQGSDADLSARLQRLEQTRDEVALLRELERIITAHGLVALRGTLTALLDRMESDGFEIAVFGRVSSGKSSLLNHLLGRPILPVGVTPVTAVPTRIRAGEVMRATIEFAQRPPIVVGLERLAEFSSEQQNPGNEKQVTHIVVEVKSERLQQGMTWVDTPGLGSLATDGAAETTAYLPRCDLGLVLVDAGASLTQEDLALLQLLLRAGAGTMVLVSKADLLEPADRQRFVDYVGGQLAALLGATLPVHPVSIKAADAALCDAWADTTLRPLLVARREQAATALKRKVGLLNETVIRILEARLGARPATARPGRSNRLADTAGALRTGDGLCGDTEQAANAQIDEVSRLAEVILESAARELREAASTKDPSALCAEVVRRSSAAHVAGIVRLLADLRQQLEGSLVKARQVLGLPALDDEPLPSPSGLPPVDANAAVRGLAAPRPGWRSLLPAGWTDWLLLVQLRDRWRSRLEEELGNYQRSLRAWLRQSVSELRAGFHAHAAPLLAQIDARSAAGSHEAPDEIQADLARLRDLAAKPADRQ